MTEIFRTLLLIVLAGTAVTFVAIFASWWFEGTRRLQRALKRVLGGPPQGEALSPAQGRAVGLNFDTESLAILWNTGASGLVYGFHEIEGAELRVLPGQGHLLHYGVPEQVVAAIDELAPQP